jgi:predicted RNase H-like HicB family nuclease
VVTEGETEAEALAMAKEAIELALEERIAEGEHVPHDN